MPTQADATKAPAARHACELDRGRIGRPPIEPQIKRFDKSARKRLRKLARVSPRFGDLLFSFPAAAYGVAIGGPSAAARAAAGAAVKAGAPLPVVAEALGAPLWYRLLPPAAFRGPLQTPEGADRLARYVVNLIPEREESCADWLEAVLLTASVAGERPAGWAAKGAIWRDDCGLARDAAPIVAAYIWHSQNMKGRHRAALGRLWSKNMSFRTAAGAARVWIETVIGRYCVIDEPNAGSWRKEQRSSGFTIAPLWPEDLEREGERMNNCISTFRRSLETGRCLLFAIRRGSKSVGSLELRPKPGARATPVIAQLEGPGNTPAGAAMTRAVEKWMGRQGPFPLTGGGPSGRRIDAEAWRGLWAEFVDAVGAAAAGPFAGEPDPARLRAIWRPLDQLERI